VTTQTLKKARVIEEDPSLAFKQAMRQLAGGVSVITAGQGDARTGLTATSFSALSSDPPSVIVCINKASSTFPVLVDQKQFGANILADHQQHIAERFAGKGGVSGPQRYVNGNWHQLASGVFILSDALASFDCVVEDMIERHSHAIVIGRVRSICVCERGASLAYWRGGFHTIPEPDSCA